MATKTKNPTPGLVYDVNLNGLYRPERAVDLIGHTLRYRQLNIPSQAHAIAFLVLVVKERVATPEELAKMNSDQVFAKVIEYLNALKDPEKTEENQVAMVRMLLNPDANQHILIAISLCFPDISEPENLTDDAFIQLIGFIFSQLNLEPDKR
jgi:hypothetical protein